MLEQVQAQCHLRGLSYADEMARLAGLWLDTEIAMGPSRASVSADLVHRYGTAGAERVRELAAASAEGDAERNAVLASPNLAAVLRVLADAGEPVGVLHVTERIHGIVRNTARDRLKRACTLGLAERAEAGRAAHLYRITERGRAAVGLIGGVSA